MKKKVITLGLPHSGKTNYVSAAMVYMAMHDSDSGRPLDTLGDWTVSVSGNRTLNETNRAVFDVINDLESDYFKKGRWCDQTIRGTYREFIFDLRGNIALWPPHLRFPKSVTIKDWAGETFAAITQGTSKDDDLDVFKKDCVEADGFLLCLDGECLVDDNVRKRMKECITDFCQVIGWIADGNSANSAKDDTANGQAEAEAGRNVHTQKGKSRHFAIVITKADVLIGVEKFGGNDTMDFGLSLEKLSNELLSMYPAFFRTLQHKGCGVDVFPVSLVPSQKFRKDDVNLGRIPSAQWNLKEVMESTLLEESTHSDFKHYHSNMYGAFHWLIDNV